MLDDAQLRAYRDDGFVVVPDVLSPRDVTRLRAIGVDEIACLIDFGVPYDEVLRFLPYLGELRDRTAR